MEGLGMIFLPSWPEGSLLEEIPVQADRDCCPPISMIPEVLLVEHVSSGLLGVVDTTDVLVMLHTADVSPARQAETIAVVRNASPSCCYINANKYFSAAPIILVWANSLHKPTNFVKIIFTLSPSLKTILDSLTKSGYPCTCTCRICCINIYII